MIRIMLLTALLVLSGCASTPKEPCQPWEPCFKRVKEAYYFHMKCENAKAEAKKKYGVSAIGMELHIRHGGKMIRCR